ncbi:MAG TPA: class I SAM-dependent methyltransferase [Chloroflexota bacterium]|nr:class I SAM-dependent methyltransferase [Chloroflexota bacterium]
MQDPPSFASLRTCSDGTGIQAGTNSNDATDARRQSELAHGRTIAGRASSVWGQDGLTGQERVRRRAGLLAAAVGAAPGMAILELGCGTGEYTARLAQHGAWLVALDLVGDLVRVARRRDLPSGVRFVLGDAERLPFPDGAFDAVVGNAVLHHLRLTAALREIWRVLRPGGLCAFTEPNMLNPQVLIQKNVPPIKRWLGDTPHETAFIAGPIRRDFERASLRVARVEPFDFLHPALPEWSIPTVQRIEARLERLGPLAQLAGSLLIVAGREPEPLQTASTQRA